MPLTHNTIKRASAQTSYVCLSCRLGALRHRSWTYKKHSAPQKKRKQAPADADTRLLQYRRAPYIDRFAESDTDDFYPTTPIVPGSLSKDTSKHRHTTNREAQAIYNVSKHKARAVNIKYQDSTSTKKCEEFKRVRFQELRSKDDDSNADSSGIPIRKLVISPSIIDTENSKVSKQKTRALKINYCESTKQFDKVHFPEWRSKHDDSDHLPKNDIARDADYSGVPIRTMVSPPSIHLAERSAKKIAQRKREELEGLFETHRAYVEQVSSVSGKLAPETHEENLLTKFEPILNDEHASNSRASPLTNILNGDDHPHAAGSSVYSPFAVQSSTDGIALHKPSRPRLPSTSLSWLMQGSGMQSQAHLLSSNIAHQVRLLHTPRRHQQQAAAVAEQSEDIPPPPSWDQIAKRESSIRTQLREWQRLHGHQENSADQLEEDMDEDVGDTMNNLTRLPLDESSFRRRDVEGEEEEEREALSAFMRSPTQDLDGAATDSRFLKVGDLVELEFPTSEKEPVIAVFARRLGYDSQFLTMQGRWIHLPERKIQYSIPDWVPASLVEPIIPYLPDPESVENKELLDEQAYMYDLAVPRDISSPLVTKMVQFDAESQEIYRRHASTLDNAHALLSHETDLRYGSLLSAATTLLKLKPHQLPVTALFTVRKALSRAGFAFNIDRRSHRLTGYLQIRSREQVSMVSQVREWLRDWQDDMAQRSALEGQDDSRKLQRHRSPRTAQYVYNFIAKAKAIVLKQRENRDATPYGNVGPSKKKFPITPKSDATRIVVDEQFTEQDTELIRFIEAWACSNMFHGLPRIESLPPLLLHAIGLYDGFDTGPRVGYLLLQEIGVVLPYENRIRFDQHLLLPSSQHSKPLQHLMTQLMEMRDKHNFDDSMKHLRHDWGDTPVYCIDEAGAREIDDGLSIMKAGDNEWWVHVHIANPTAFFERDHGLAKMARHMGESIYMPERTYMMLPRWTTDRHFSLAKDRPCLTFSTRMDSEGNTLETKVQSGIIRNVKQLTPAEVGQVLGVEEDLRSKIVLTVGGEVPPSKTKKSALPSFSETEKEDLRVLQKLSEKRSDKRRRAGGVFFEMHNPDVEVWASWRGPGLGWDHPYRKGSRTVEGDPVIRIQTQGLVNWFQPHNDAPQNLVREMMLLACETAATWCSERQIPAIFRGSVRRPDTPDPNVFRREILDPAAQESPDGSYPMHLGVRYVRALGGTALSSSPFRHAMLGMDHYGKVTSPLRRYGDMILHWQIEAALREEARSGRSLITKNKNADRSFLPFSRPVLDTIMLGLQPREAIVNRAKGYAEAFWTNMVLFRAYHFNELELPFWTEAHPTKPDGTVKPRMRMMVYTPHPTVYGIINAANIDLNVSVNMLRPSRFGLEEVQQGDIWEGEIDHVDAYLRVMVVRPTRLAHREKMGPKEIQAILARAQ